MNSINHQIRLAARPSGLPKPSDWGADHGARAGAWAQGIRGRGSPPVDRPGDAHLDQGVSGDRDRGRVGAVPLDYRGPRFDAAIDHKAEEVRGTLRDHAPDGIDVFLDNVGGDILDAVLTRLAPGARIVFSAAYPSTTCSRPAARRIPWS